MTESTISITARFGYPRPPVCEGFTPSGFYPPIDNYVGDNWVLADATGNVFYVVAGIAWPTEPSPFHRGTLYYNKDLYHTAFPSFPLGWGSFAEAGYPSVVVLSVIGGGIATIHLAGMSAPGHKILWQLRHQNPRGSDQTVFDQVVDSVPLVSDSASTLTVTVPGFDSGFCAHQIFFYWRGSGTTNEGWVGFGGFDWAADGDRAVDPRRFLRGHVTYAPEM